MNSELAPKYQRLFGGYWVLWYSKSNNYSIVEPDFKTLLDYYFQSNSVNEFADKIILDDAISDSDTIVKNLESYLRNCNTTNTQPSCSTTKFKTSHRKIVNQYLVNEKRIQINYDSDLVKKTIHPSLAHLEVAQKNDSHVMFDIYIDNNQLCLFKNKQLLTTVPKHDYHLVQGKFIMHLLCVIHDCEESDWLGTFHGSTISDGENSILFVGKSGKGKSTLCALLAANGFELLADDVSPMLSKNRHIYYNPSAISIKEGAFTKLQSEIENFEELPITLFNKSKGQLKYIPSSYPQKDNYPCKAIIMVNYKKGSKTILEQTSIKALLETLIPDSWLSHNLTHAKQFLDWLNNINIYQLTYSNTESVINELSVLFKGLKKN